MIKSEPTINLKIELAEISSLQAEQSTQENDASELSESSLSCLMCEYVGNDRSDIANHKKENHSDRQFPCKYCDKKFPNQLSNLKRHIANTHGKAIKPSEPTPAPLSENCLACDYSASSKKFLIQHRKVHEEVKCKVCQKNFRKSWKALDLHFTKEHLQKEVDSEQILIQPELDESNISKNETNEKIEYEFPMECYSCDEVLGNKTELRTHNKEHEYYSCKLCGYKGTLWANLRRHFRAIHESKKERVEEKLKPVGGAGNSFSDITFPIECYSCNVIVTDKQELRLHNKTHNSYPCKFCDYNSALWANLRRHFDNVHGSAKTKGENSENSAAVMECFCCETTFKNARDKKMHIKTHSNFICKTCQFEGKNWEEINKHFMKIHLYMDHIYSFPMECYACDQVIYSKGELRIHNRQHEVFQCKVCEHKFTLFSNLRKHYETFHMIKAKEEEPDTDDEDDSMNLGCFMCDYQIKNKTDQKLHNRKHEEYICKVCGYSAKRLVCNLQRHFISKHPEAVLPVYRPQSELVMFVEGLNESNDYYENEEFVEEEMIDELEEATTEMPKFHSTMVNQQEMSEEAEDDEDNFNQIIEYSAPTVQNIEVVQVKSSVAKNKNRVKNVSIKHEEENDDEESVPDNNDEEDMEYEEQSPKPKQSGKRSISPQKIKSSYRRYECFSCHFFIEGNYEVFRQHVYDMHLGINICKICALHYHDDWYELRDHCLAKHKSRIKVWMDEEDENYDDIQKDQTEEHEECLECDFTSRNPTTMLKHYRNLHQQQHICKICGANFKNLLSNLRRHYSTQHCKKDLTRKERKEQPVFKFSLIDNPVGNFECLVCHEEDFVNCKEWNMHLWTHKGQYNCKVCHAVMKSPMNLKRHIIAKHPNRQFAMDIVGWIENPVSSDSNFDCMVKNCDLSFVTHEEWIEHTKKGHKDVLSCKLCGKVSANVYSFQFHLDNAHTKIWNRGVRGEGGKTHTCYVCKKVFRSAINLAIHSKTHKLGVSPNALSEAV